MSLVWINLKISNGVNRFTGRFTQADTYHGDGLNLYVYAGNNPVKYVDPSGHYKNNGVKSGMKSGKDLIKNISRIEYGSDELSKAAIKFRKDNNITSA